MDHFVVTGMRPYDGRYPFDLAAPHLTVREWGWLKDLAGVFPADYTDRAVKGDYSLLAAECVFAIRRAGRIGNDEVGSLFERFKDVDLDATVELELGEREDADAVGPPAERPSSNGDTSGHGSTTSSETSEATPPSIGGQGSAFSEFDLIRSGS